MTRVSGIGRARHGSRSSDTRDTHSHLVPAPVATLQAPHLGLLILVGDVGLGRLTLGRDRLMALGDDVDPFESIAELGGPFMAAFVRPVEGGTGFEKRLLEGLPFADARRSEGRGVGKDCVSTCRT